MVGQCSRMPGVSSGLAQAFTSQFWITITIIGLFQFFKLLFPIPIVLSSQIIHSSYPDKLNSHRPWFYGLTPMNYLPNHWFQHVTSMYKIFSGLLVSATLNLIPLSDFPVALEHCEEWLGPKGWVKLAKELGLCPIGLCFLQSKRILRVEAEFQEENLQGQQYTTFQSISFYLEI